MYNQCKYCGVSFKTSRREQLFCSKQCSAQGYVRKKKKATRTKPEKRKSQIDAKLKQSGGDYSSLQRAETISMFARVIVEAS